MRSGSGVLPDDLAGVGHVVAHGRSLDVIAIVGEWPDGILNLIESQRTFGVHRQIGDDGSDGVARGTVGRRDRETAENVDVKAVVRFSCECGALILYLDGRSRSRAVGGGAVPCQLGRADLAQAGCT